MFEGMIGFAFGGFYGGNIGSILSYWESIGFFSYVLPFLLIFALIFGVLSRSQIFKENNAINAVIALAVSFMALQFDMVPIFFAEIFPRLGVGLAMVLVALIMVGLFMSSKQIGILFWVGAIIFIAILISTSGALGWSSASFWYENWGWILAIGLAVGGFIWVINSFKPKSPLNVESSFANSPWGRSLDGKP